jgi:hypothetical protein
VWNASFAALPAAAAADFLALGHYTVDLPAGGVTAIVLSTNVFSANSPNASTACAAGSAPQQTLDWLDATLGALRQRGRTAWVAGHIAPGIDDY